MVRAAVLAASCCMGIGGCVDATAGGAAADAEAQDASADATSDTLDVTGEETPACPTTGCSAACPCPQAHDRCVDGACLCQPRCEDECGTDGCGGYCLRYPDDGGDRWHFRSLCDETDRVFIEARADCEDGWCRIPGNVSFHTQPPFGPGVAIQGKIIPPLPPRPVVLSRAFEVMQTEVTQGQWMEILSPTENPSRHAACGPDCPVESISLFDMLAFANTLSGQHGYLPCYTLNGCTGEPGLRMACVGADFAGPDCEGYRLPSEMEWELAAGAASPTCYADFDFVGNTPSCANPFLEELGWFCGNCDVTYEGCVEWSSWRGDVLKDFCCGTHPVAQLAAGPFGVFDVYGNILEATGSVLHPLLYQHPLDPLSAPDLDPGYDGDFDGATDFLVLRGGDFGTSDAYSCSNTRYAYAIAAFDPEGYGYVGFRLVRTLPKEEAP